MKKLSKEEAANVLAAWTALEVLLPQPYRSPEDLTAGNRESIIPLKRGERLPWEGDGEQVHSKLDNEGLFYQVIIGTLSLEKVTAALLKKYSDEDPEKPSETGQAIMAVALVDYRGCLLKKFPSVALSSFAWGVPRALKGELTTLGDWPEVERELLKGFEELLRRHDDYDNPVALDESLLRQAYHYLIERFQIPLELTTNTSFAIRLLKKRQRPSPLLLNSFFLGDLKSARDTVLAGRAPEGLKRYLGMKVTTTRHDLLNCHRALEAAVAPLLIPPACWPAPGGHSLLLLQQAAVNLAFSRLAKGGILAVNGPPGTGKTTLLRDVVSGVVTQRAEAMCRFDDPATAFVATTQKVRAGAGWWTLRTLDPALKGFEMLFTSSNNNAVENISRELPNRHALADSANDLHYFSVLSDELFGYTSWGLIAAVLGNGKNCNHFNKIFWQNKEVGLSTYLAQACGVKQSNISETVKDKQPPKIVQHHSPPGSHQEALARWRQARQEFQTILAQSRKKLAELGKLQIRLLGMDASALKDTDLPTVAAQLAQHTLARPCLLSVLLHPLKAVQWHRENSSLLRLHQQLLYRNDLGPRLIDQQRLREQEDEQGRAALHTSVPWCDQDAQTLRRQLFVAAMKLHKAFIDAAAKPLRHNLGAFMQQLTTPSPLDSDKLHLLPDLWSTFFLVVPCVSSTFASIDRMLGKLPHESLGWLLIDEAGQAVPQAAVGALMRAKRAIVVGDPMQIEPIVQLPSSLTQQICQHFSVDSDRFNAPVASTQTLADSASAYFTELESRYGSRSVGVPLLVHRRCSEPMFSIANDIAYDHLMVQEKPQKHSPIYNALGPSTWFDITGPAEDKWSPAEGKKVEELLIRLGEARVAPDIYILTPFKMVAAKVRELIKQNKLLAVWEITDEKQWLSDRVGTVHRMQGREAEAVILVLGAPAANQTGTRHWAGAKPNILNVAVTRAKEVIYVIGNRTLWREAGIFKALSDALPR